MKTTFEAQRSWTGFPEWVQSVLPKLVGAVVKWSRRGRIVLPTSTLEFYAGTKASRTCPFTGERRASYRLLLDALQRCGVIGGLLRARTESSARVIVREATSGGRQAGDRRGGMAQSIAT